MHFEIYQADPAASQTTVATVAARVFDQIDAGDIKWRLEQMPDVSLFLAGRGDQVVGFKAGYAATTRRYYSWLGGVDPEFRRSGVAGKLMQAQHDWLATTAFQLVETHVMQANAAMIQLNLNAGFAVTGMYMKSGRPSLIMQREIV